MRYKHPDKKLFVKNREKIKRHLPLKSLAILASNDEMPRNGDQFFAYRQHSNLFYLTGIEQEKTLLILFPGHPDPLKREVVFTLKPNEDMETWEGHKNTPEEISSLSGIQNVQWLDRFDAFLQEFMEMVDQVYLDRNEYPKFSTSVATRDERLIKSLQNSYPLHEFKRLAPFMKAARLVKEAEEIAMMQQASLITGNGFREVLANLKPGMYEYEIEALLTGTFLRHGASGHAYAPIVASGVHACALHYVHNDGICSDGALLLIDFGAEYGNYAADCSRTIPVNGRFTERQKALYQAVLEVQKEAIKLFIPGNTINRVNEKVNKMMEEQMIKLGLFTKEEVARQDKSRPLYFRYFMHGTSHFIGLDVHDVGDKDTPFKEGMVLTCEPGIYVKEEQTGIRIEDDILVATEPVNLTAAIPKEIDEIENLMQIGS
jgi:Xaa-Pro aminopeptidase